MTSESIVKDRIRVVDVFAGPGGLAEGFAAVRREDGSGAFKICLSIEKDRAAYKTLKLRSFFRQFTEVPSTYYKYLAGTVTLEDLTSTHPPEWEKAGIEALNLELGADGSSDILDPILDEIIGSGGGPLVLIGGPPCQAYSLVGRARNMGNDQYVAKDDGRHFLYKEYIRLIDKLNPDAFVMENVKGLLSSKLDGELVIDQIISDLQTAGSAAEGYLLFPIAIGGRGPLGGYVIRAEEYGIPQKRHRVIIVGVKSDSEFIKTAEELSQLSLRPFGISKTVGDTLSGMPKLRSGLSKEPDSPDNWKQAVLEAIEVAANGCYEHGEALAGVARKLRNVAENLRKQTSTPERYSTDLAPISDNWLSDWICDPAMASLPNHETRGHIREDLSRYAFAASFAEVFKVTPKAKDFPAALAPRHKNWTSGKFADRFRVQCWGQPGTTVTSHISKDGHYFIHPDPTQCRSLTVREAARLQTFPDNYLFEGNRTEQYVQVGNAVPPLLALQIAKLIENMISY